MASVKSQGSTQNGRDSHGQRLGVKVFGAQAIHAGSVIVKQRGTRFFPGENVGRGSDDTLFAKITGLVSFREFKKGSKMVSVEPKQA